MQHSILDQPPYVLSTLAQGKINYTCTEILPSKVNVLGLGGCGRNVIEYFRNTLQSRQSRVPFFNLVVDKSLMPNIFLEKYYFAALDVIKVNEHINQEVLFSYFSKRETNIICVGFGGNEGTFLTEILSYHLISKNFPLKVIVQLPFAFEDGRDKEYSLLLIKELKKYIEVDVIDPEIILENKKHLLVTEALEILNNEFYSRLFK